MVTMCWAEDSRRGEERRGEERRGEERRREERRGGEQERRGDEKRGGEDRRVGEERGKSVNTGEVIRILVFPSTANSIISCVLRLFLIKGLLPTRRLL